MRFLRNFWKIYFRFNNKFIELDKTPIENIERELSIKLQEFGIKLNTRSDEEIYNRILDNNKLSLIYPFKNFFYDVVNIIKESINREKYQEIITSYIEKLTSEKEQAKKQYYWKIWPLWETTL